MSENENKSSSSTEEKTDQQLEQEQSEQKSSGRRKFLKGAVATSPILLTVASKPVWAAKCSLSGEMSGNLSNHDDQPCDSEGCTPKYWKNRGNMLGVGSLGGWHPKFPPVMLFDDQFAFNRNVFYDKTLLDVMKLGKLNRRNFKLDPKPRNKKNDPYKDIEVNVNGCTAVNAKKLIIRLAIHAVAGLQNAATNVRYPYSVRGGDPAHPSVIVRFQQAWDSANAFEIESLLNDFKRANNLTCPFDNNW